jgi:hypothetical protein
VVGGNESGEIRLRLFAADVLLGACRTEVPVWVKAAEEVVWCVGCCYKMRAGVLFVATAHEGALWLAKSNEPPPLLFLVGSGVRDAGKNAGLLLFETVNSAC